METVTCWSCRARVSDEEVCFACGEDNPGVARAPDRGPLAVARFPWGPFTITDGIDVLIGREEGPFAGELIDCPKISRRHLRLRAHDSTIHLTDLASRNGTFINDVRLEPYVEVPVVVGCRVRLGATFEVAIDPVESGRA